MVRKSQPVEQPMTEPRYRLRADGILLYFCDKEGRFVPMLCDDYDHYCGKICKYFKTDGNTAIIGCNRPETMINLEP